MAGRHYYLLTALPPFGELDGGPPLTGHELVQRVIDSAGPQELIETILLSDDLVQREALLSGEIQQSDPAVLRPGQMRDEEPLPDWAAGPVGDEQQARAIAADTVWAAYYRHAAWIAGKMPGRFLALWVGFEVALRNTLAAARAKALDLEASDYLVEPELGQTDADLGGLLNEWTAAPNPLAALRVVDMGRWRWLDEHDASFTFSSDELAAYAARVMLLQRWRRLTETDVPGAADARQ